MGYDGIDQSLVIEFDFEIDPSMNDPTYPHISVQFKSTSSSANHDYSLAFAYLSEHLVDSSVHNVRIVYKKELDKIDFRHLNLRVNFSLIV